jgi:hypothetical protein
MPPFRGCLWLKGIKALKMKPLNENSILALDLRLASPLLRISKRIWATGPKKR